MKVEPMLLARLAAEAAFEPRPIALMLRRYEHVELATYAAEFGMAPQTLTSQLVADGLERLRKAEQEVVRQGGVR